MHRFFLLFCIPAVALAAPVRVCVIGDSISAGFAPSTHGWATELKIYIAQHPELPHDFGVLNLSHSGDKIANAQAIYDAGVVGRIRRPGAKYDGCTWVAFLIGTNDLPDGT